MDQWSHQRYILKTFFIFPNSTLMSLLFGSFQVLYSPYIMVSLVGFSLCKSNLLAKLRYEEVHHIAWIEKCIKKSICA